MDKIQYAIFKYQRAIAQCEIFCICTQNIYIFYLNINVETNSYVINKPLGNSKPRNLRVNRIIQATMRTGSKNLKTTNIYHDKQLFQKNATDESNRCCKEAKSLNLRYESCLLPFKLQNVYTIQKISAQKY